MQVNANKFVDYLVRTMVPTAAEKATWRSGARRRLPNMLMDRAANVGLGAADVATPAWRYFVPQTAEGGVNWGLGLQRAGIAAGGSFTVGSAYRTFGGEGSPFSDQRGNFDIAGIPFI